MNLTDIILPFGQAYYFCLEGREVLNKNLYRGGGAVLWSNPLVKHALRTCIANKNLIEAVHEVITCTLYGVCKRLVAKLRVPVI